MSALIYASPKMSKFNQKPVLEIKMFKMFFAFAVLYFVEARVFRQKEIPLIRPVLLLRSGLNNNLIVLLK